MASRETNEPRMLAWLSAVVMGVCLLASSGCVHIDNYTKFSGVDQFETSGAPLSASVHDWVDFEVISLLTLSSKSTNALPFAIEVCALDESGTHRELVIDYLEIVYADG